MEFNISDTLPNIDTKGSEGNFPTNAGSPAPNMMQHAMGRLTQDYGWAPHIAAGIVGNLWHESVGGNTTALGDGGKSFGLAQWNNKRRTGLANFATQQGKPA